MTASLREIDSNGRAAQSGRRRWFSAPSADLYVWQDGEGRITAFEFCYDKPFDEHALRWETGCGLRHLRIDDGEQAPHVNATPIAVPDGRFDPADIALRFEALAGGIDPRIYRFVLICLYSG